MSIKITNTVIRSSNIEQMNINSCRGDDEYPFNLVNNALDHEIADHPSVHRGNTKL
jgi:hypothetical protein